MTNNDALDLQFDSQYRKAILNVLVTADQLSSLINGVLRPFGLSKEQYNVLRVLSDRHPQPSTIQFITGRMISKSSNV